MARITIFVSVACLFVAVSCLTSCSAARWLPYSFETSNHVSSSETSMTSSGNKPTSVEATSVESSKSIAYSTSIKFDEGIAGSDWEEFSEEEFGACMDAEIVGEDESSGEAGAERPCRRILRAVDYHSTGSPNINGKKL